MLLESQPETQAQIKAFHEAIESALDSLIPPQSSVSHALLFEAARYSLLSPAAKRLRPLLLLATVDALGGSREAALIPACSLELIHTYSLIHDDLPCMDDDDLRRGRPTLHKVYPEGQAILAGDFLLTYAFEKLATAPHLSALQKIDLITSLAQSAGGEGMIGGQVIDLSLAQAKTLPSWEVLCAMHRKKTAALIVAAIDCGAIISHASTSTRELLQKAGQSLGLAFQIVDDILDVMGREEEIGKPVGSDARNAKTTAVSLLGLDRARALSEELLASAEELLSSLPSSHLLFSLARTLVHRTS
jgi:geranylgeranyl diphosphate synthase type II